MKRRNCNLELRLLPPNTDCSTPHHHQMKTETGRGSPQEQQQYQPLTIFYKGRICVCDVTELQARAILLLASRETEEKATTPTGTDPISPSLQSQLYSPTTGLSMRRSLQLFLQKRKNRMEATSPYHRYP